jgi:hypothetical protein
LEEVVQKRKAIRTHRQRKLNIPIEDTDELAQRNTNSTLVPEPTLDNMGVNPKVVSKKEESILIEMDNIHMNTSINDAAEYIEEINEQESLFDTLKLPRELEKTLRDCYNYTLNFYLTSEDGKFAFYTSKSCHNKGITSKSAPSDSNLPQPTHYNRALAIESQILNKEEDPRLKASTVTWYKLVTVDNTKETYRFMSEKYLLEKKETLKNYLYKKAENKSLVIQMPKANIHITADTTNGRLEYFAEILKQSKKMLKLFPRKYTTKK